MDQLIELAKRLGKQMADNERTVTLKDAQKKVNEDSKAAELIKSYQDQAQKIAELEKQGKPIEVDDKQALQKIEQDISMHPSLAELTRRQVDFVEMMRKVKQAIDQQLEIEV